MNFVTWFLNGWGLAAILSLCIAGWAMFQHLHYRAQFRSLQRNIRDGVGLLSSIDTPISFYQRLRVSGQALEANPILGSRWREYRATLLAARGDKPLRSPRPATDFFNEDLYRSGDIDIRAYEALPNQFVGIGLCLTFFGLIVSLFIAQSVITADAGSATDELSKLLQAASFKFVTSVVALVASVIFVFAKNRRLYATEKDIHEFCQQIERLIPPVTPEELAEESNQELARQGEQLEAANRILATGIADALEEKLTAAMTVATQPLIETVRTMTERLSDVNRSALEHMAQRFSETLAGATLQHTDRIAQLLTVAGNAIGEVPQQINAASEAMADEMTRAVAAVDSAFEGWSVKMVEAGDAAAARLMDRTSQQADQLAKALRQEGAALLEGMSSVADQLVSAPDKIDVAGEAFSAVVDGANARFCTSVDAAGGKFVLAFGDAAEKIAGGIASMDRFIARTDEVTGRMEDISGGLANQLDGLVKGADAITARLSKVSHEVAIAGDAAQSLVRIAERMEQLSGDLGSAVNNLGHMTELSGAATRETQHLVISLGQRAEAMEREMETFDASLISVFERVSGGFEQFSNRTSDYMSQLDAGFATAIARFGVAIRDLDSTVERLAQANAANVGGELADQAAARGA